MSSLLSQFSIPSPSISSFLRGYDCSLPVSPEQWAEAESIGLPTGMLVFCLERNREGDSAVESFTATQLGVVVGENNGRPVVVSIKPDTYEMSLLKGLLQNKAHSARESGTNFYYLLVRPLSELPDETIQKIEQIGLSYSRGGSRQGRKPGGSGPSDPVIPLLSALGLSIDSAAERELLDIGALCHGVFQAPTPDSTSAIHNVQAILAAVPRTLPAAEVDATEAPPASEQSKSAEKPQEGLFPLPSTLSDIPTPSSLSTDTKPASASAEAVANSSAPAAADPQSAAPLETQTEQLKDDLQRLFSLGGMFSTIADSNPARIDPSPADSTSETGSALRNPRLFSKPPSPPPKIDFDRQESAPWTDSPTTASQPSGSSSDLDTPKSAPSAIPPPDKLPHLPSPWDAPETDTAPQAAAPSATPPPDILPRLPSPWDTPETDSAPQAAAPSATPLPDILPRLPSPWDTPETDTAPQAAAPSATPPPDVSLQTLLVSDPSGSDIAAHSSAESMAQPRDLSVPQSDLPELNPSDISSLPPVREKVTRTTPSVPNLPAHDQALSDLSLAKLFMGLQGTSASTGTMETPVVKLYQRVKETTAKLLIQVDQIQAALEKDLKELLEKVARSESKDEASFMSTQSKTFKELDENAEESRVRLSDSAANNRYSIKQSLESHRSLITEKQAEILENLLNSCVELKSGSEQLLEFTQTEISKLIKGKSVDLSSLIESICKQLLELKQSHLLTLDSKFERLNHRVSEESQSISRSFEHLVESLSEDISGVCERASDKLKSAKRDFELNLQQAASIWQLELSLLVKSLKGTELDAKLRQHKDQLTGTIAALQATFAEQSVQRSEKRLTEFKSNYLEAKRQQQQLLCESLGALESSAQEQMAKVIAVFDDTTNFVAQSRLKSNQLLESIESQFNGSAEESRNIVEATNADHNSELIASRDSTIAKLQNLKQQSVDALLKAIDTNCQQLEETSAAEQAKLIANREQRIQTIRDQTQSAVAQIQQAIQDAFESIQQSREKFLE